MSRIKTKLMGFGIYAMCIAFVLGVISLGVGWEYYRYTTFKEETGSKISYLKWKFVIESEGNKR